MDTWNLKEACSLFFLQDEKENDATTFSCFPIIKSTSSLVAEIAYQLGTYLDTVFEFHDILTSIWSELWGISSCYGSRIQKIWSEELSYCRSWLMMVIVSIAMDASHSLLSHREPILSNLLQSYTGCTIFTRLYTGWLHVLPGPVWKARLPKISFQLVQGFLKSFGQSFPFESQRFFDDVMNQIDLSLCGALQGFHQLQQGSEIYNK